MSNTFRLAIDPNPNLSIKMMEMKMVELTKTPKIYSIADDETTNEDSKQQLFDARWNVKRPTILSVHRKNGRT